MKVSSQQVNKIVKGQQNLTIETIDKLEMALEISLIEIVNFKTNDSIIDISNSEERVSVALKQMKKAMPIIKKEVAVYEENMRLGKNQKNPTIAPQFKNI